MEGGTNDGAEVHRGRGWVWGCRIMRGKKRDRERKGNVKMGKSRRYIYDNYAGAMNSLAMLVASVKKIDQTLSNKKVD